MFAWVGSMVWRCALRPPGFFRCGIQGLECVRGAEALEVSAGQAGEREHGDSAKELPWDR